MGKTSVVLMALVCSGCSYLGSAEDFDPADLEREAGWVAAKDVPLILQQDQEDCGAAALAMALAHWQIPVCFEDVLRACPPEPGQGIKAGTLRAFAREKGLQAFLFHGTFADFEKELSHGRPVLVGLVKPYVNGGLTHYEVVVGIHPSRQEVVTLDPAHGWRRNGFVGFLAEWEPAERLTLVILRAPAEPAAR